MTPRPVPNAEANEEMRLFLRDKVVTDMYPRVCEDLKRLDRALAASVADQQAMREALEVIPPDRLELLADWLDTRDALDGRTGNEVQRDLRRMATLSRAVLARVPADQGER